MGLQGAQARGQAPDLAFLAKTRILEIHSRKSQSHRTKVADAFRDATGGCCLFTSDVSARGMDYPDVTRVIQFGAPADAAQYVHRLGRTARAGKEGSGCLLLSDFEAYFLEDKAIKALPIAMQRPLVAGDATGAVLGRVDAALMGAARALPPETCGAAYQAWLGFYNSSLRRLRWDPCANQIFNPTSMCAYANVLTLALPPCFENSLRAIDSSKNQPNRRRFGRAREF